VELTRRETFWATRIQWLHAWAVCQHWFKIVEFFVFSSNNEINQNSECFCFNYNW